jgi:ATP adenylyltransferase
MQTLPTPWRMDYIRRGPRNDGCIFCDLLASPGTDAERFILRRDPEAFLVLNIYPYTPGHLMAVPYRHAPNLSALAPEELDALWRLSQLGERMLRRAYGCRSVQIGANLGRAAGAGVPTHVHLHVVAWPESVLWERWTGADSPTATLRQSYDRLQAVRRGLEA